MSFDIFYMPCRYGSELVETTNPATGEVQTFPRNEPLSSIELKAVRDVLQRAGARGPDQHGYYEVGRTTEVFGENLESGCMVVLRGMTNYLLQFLFDLMKAGNWVMIPTIKDFVAITTAPECVKGIPDGFPRIVRVETPEDLGALLVDGFHEWEKYRDQVVGKDGV